MVEIEVSSQDVRVMAALLKGERPDGLVVTGRPYIALGDTESGRPPSTGYVTRSASSTPGKPVAMVVVLTLAGGVLADLTKDVAVSLLTNFILEAAKDTTAKLKIGDREVDPNEREVRVAIQLAVPAGMEAQIKIKASKQPVGDDNHGQNKTVK